LLRRHASGSTYPRTLHQKSGLLGNQITTTLLDIVSRKGAVIARGSTCRHLLVNQAKIAGLLVEDKDGVYQVIEAPVVVVAWGGVGNLFPESTNPSDVDGSGLAIAFESGASLVDLEFIEFEPTVMIWPPKVKGELFLTALFGEGAYLRNGQEERFLLRLRPQGEAGCPKTVLNKAIWHEIAEGRGTNHHGVYADLRHIPPEKIRPFSWFYHRLNSAGLDPGKDLLEVAPSPHSHSGGIAVNTSSYETDIAGLYAIGEAAGGIHGACRMAGNSATQALVSALLCGDDILNSVHSAPSLPVGTPQPRKNERIRRELLPKIGEIIGHSLGPIRCAETLQKGFDNLISLYPKSTDDEFTRHRILCGLLLVQASFFRRESRGNHFRSDYPQLDEYWNTTVKVKRGVNGEIECQRIPVKPLPQIVSE
jgi:aspartate oxidase